MTISNRTTSVNKTKQTNKKKTFPNIFSIDFFLGDVAFFWLLSLLILPPCYCCETPKSYVERLKK